MFVYIDYNIDKQKTVFYYDSNILCSNGSSTVARAGQLCKLSKLRNKQSCIIVAQRPQHRLCTFEIRIFRQDLSSADHCVHLEIIFTYLLAFKYLKKNLL